VPECTSSSAPIASSAASFGDREIEVVRLLIPHVRRAVTISNVLDVQAIEKARMAETLDALKLGVVLANEDSRILHANRAAEAMMRDGGPLRGRGGVLRAEGGAASWTATTGRSRTCSRSRTMSSPRWRGSSSSRCAMPR
jgi:hypothetical protein